MISFLKCIFKIWFKCEKNLENFSPSSFMLYLSISIIILITASSFLSRFILFHMGYLPFFSLEYFFIESLFLTVVVGCQSLFLDYSTVLHLLPILDPERKNCLLFFLISTFFKDINDNFGHPVGDRVISFVAEKLKSVFGEPMCVGRLGGEEFAAAALNYSEKEAAALAEKVRMLIEYSSMGISAEQSIHVTLSAGVAECFQKELISTVVRHADKALYVAKKSGRNRVVCFSEILPTSASPVKKGRRYRDDPTRNIISSL